MRGIWAALVVGLGLAFTTPGPAQAERLEVRISISQQQMRVYHEGRLLFQWPVSTAGRGSVTKAGIYKPEFLSKNHRSRRYNNAPMPFAIFYDGNYAIHGTTQVRKLGRPASHGCVRLHPDNARILFGMVKAEGMENMRISIAQ